MKKVLAILLASIMLLAGFTLAEGAQDVKIGFSQMNLSNAHFVKLAAGWTAFCEEYGLEDIILSANDSADTQASQVETWLNSDFDAIAICALDGNAMHNACQKADEMGVPILNVYNLLEGDYDAATPNPDDIQGMTMAKVVADYINNNEPWKSMERIEFATINNDTVKESIIRMDTIEQYMIDNCPNVVFVGTALGAQSAEMAMQATENLFQKYPDLQIVFANNDSAGLGVYQAFVNAGKTDPDKYIICGNDAIPEVCKLIKQGSVYQFSVDPNAYAAGYQMAKMTYQLAVEDPELDPIWTFELVGINKDNVQTVIDRNVELGLMEDIA